MQAEQRSEQTDIGRLQAREEGQVHRALLERLVHVGQLRRGKMVGVQPDGGLLECLGAPKEAGDAAALQAVPAAAGAPPHRPVLSQELVGNKLLGRFLQAGWETAKAPNFKKWGQTSAHRQGLLGFTRRHGSVFGFASPALPAGAPELASPSMAAAGA